MDNLLKLIEEEESREARETMAKILDESCITKFTSVEDINKKIQPMGYAEKTKNQIYKDNRVQDYYTNSTNNGTHEMNTGLKLFGKLKECQEDLTDVQMLNRQNAALYMPVTASCLYG